VIRIGNKPLGILRNATSRPHHTKRIKRPSTPSYAYEERDGLLVISPKIEYLEELGNRQCVADFSFPLIDLPILSIKAQNTSDHVVCPTSISIEARASRVTREPIPTVSAYAGGLFIINEGWGGPMLNP
jgi:hypothetical protein